jgi:hypothetical protein
MTIEPYNLFKIYQSINYHFANNNYNYQKYKGNIATTYDTFQNRKDKYSFIKSARYFNNENHAKLFILAVIIGNGIKIGKSLPHITSLVDQDNINTYNIYQGKIDRMQYMYQNDISFLLDYGKHYNINNINNILHGYDNQYPIWHKLVVNNKINIESIIILDIILNFIINIKIKDIYFDQFLYTTKQYKYFININNQFYHKLTKSIFEVSLSEHI